MKIEKVKLETLNLLPKNIRVHDSRQIQFLIGELKKKGQTRPLHVNRKPVRGKANVIIGGNGAYEAMKRIGWTEGYVQYFDFEEAEALEHAIKENRSFELGRVHEGFLKDTVGELVESGIEPEELGYNFEEYADLMGEEDGGGLGGEEERPEVEFTEEFMESHNYVLLYFDNEIDWQTAVEKLKIRPVHATGSKPGTAYELIGKGRVVKGIDVVRRLRD